MGWSTSSKSGFSRSGSKSIGKTKNYSKNFSGKRFSGGGGFNTTKTGFSNTGSQYTSAYYAKQAAEAAAAAKKKAEQDAAKKATEAKITAGKEALSKKQADIAKHRANLEKYHPKTIQYRRSLPRAELRGVYGAPDSAQEAYNMGIRGISMGPNIPGSGQVQQPTINVPPINYNYQEPKEPKERTTLGKIGEALSWYSNPTLKIIQTLANKGLNQPKISDFKPSTGFTTDANLGQRLGINTNPNIGSQYSQNFQGAYQGIAGPNPPTGYETPDQFEIKDDNLNQDIASLDQHEVKTLMSIIANPATPKYMKDKAVEAMEQYAPKSLKNLYKNFPGLVQNVDSQSYQIAEVSDTSDVKRDWFGEGSINEGEYGVDKTMDTLESLGLGIERASIPRDTQVAMLGQDDLGSKIAGAAALGITSGIGAIKDSIQNFGEGLRQKNLQKMGVDPSQNQSWGYGNPALGGELGQIASGADYTGGFAQNTAAQSNDPVSQQLQSNINQISNRLAAQYNSTAAAPNISKDFSSLATAGTNLGSDLGMRTTYTRGLGTDTKALRRNQFSGGAGSNLDRSLAQVSGALKSESDQIAQQANLGISNYLEQANEQRTSAQQTLDEIMSGRTDITSQIESLKKQYADVEGYDVSGLESLRTEYDTAIGLGQQDLTQHDQNVRGYVTQWQQATQAPQWTMGVRAKGNLYKSPLQQFGRKARTTSKKITQPGSDFTISGLSSAWNPTLNI